MGIKNPQLKEKDCKSFSAAGMNIPPSGGINMLSVIKKMAMRHFTFYIFGLHTILMVVLTGCATRPYFAIENKTNKEIKIELFFDSLNLKETVAQFIQANRHQHNFSNYCINDPECDSIKNSLTENIVNNYIYDSLEIKSFFFFTQFPRGIEEFQIGRINLSEKEFDSGNFNVFYNSQKLIDYYHWDSPFVKKIINEKILTLFLPSYNRFSKQCAASGDLSCDIDDSFPNVKEIKIIIDEDNIIVLTKQNFKLLMKNKTILRQPDSY